MKAAIYSRKSKFTGKGDSVENQIQLCLDYAKNLGIKDFLIYEDEGYSGGTIDRPKFQQMIEDAREKKFDYLICYRLDRISRSIADFSALIEELNNLDIHFISIREQFDTTTPMGRAMMYIASVFAQLERETISERVRDNMYQLAKTGRWLGGASPLGYDKEEVLYVENGKERKMSKLVINCEEEKIIRFIFDTYIKTKSMSKTSKLLQKNNMSGKNGGTFNKGGLADLLKNPLYVKANEDVVLYLESQGITVEGEINDLSGILTYRKNKNNKEVEKEKWIAAVAMHSGIIDSKDWLLVQQILEKNKDKAPRAGTSNIALLSGLMRCKCGYSMRVKFGVKRKDGTRPMYYACSNKDTLGIEYCQNKNIRADEIEEVIENHLENLDEKQLITQFYSDKTKEKNNNSINKTENINKTIETKEIAISNLIKQLSAFTDTAASSYIITEIEKLNKDIQELKNELEKINNTTQKTNADIMNIHILVDNIKRFNKDKENLSLDERRFLLSTIIKKIIWDSEKQDIKITYSIE
jgi:site-specific DNA recombinase